MSSATRVQSEAGKSVIGAAMGRIARLGMTPRQQVLNRYWAAYRCQSYDARRVDWNGQQTTDPVEHEAIASAGFIPPGFYDAGGQMLPLKYRRPTAPYNLVKVVVDRFTGLLFSERRHPQLRVEGDSVTEDFVQGLAEASRLWPSMIQARAFGGATGTVAVGFQFIDGKPIIEVHDPRWVRPDFVNRVTFELRAIEKRFQFPMEVLDQEKGEYVEVSFWYRRVIDQKHDVLWKPIPVGEGDEPNWDDPNLIESAVEHGFGECPVQWVQNLPVSDSIDGDPDAHGIYDMVEMIDSLLSQANRGTLRNADPTVVVVSQDGLAEVAKGSDNAIKLTPGGDAKYMEMSGSGVKAARELAEETRHKALEVAQCVLEHPDMANRTATEIERVYSSMLAKADVLREQYGERCVKPLMEKMIRAARKTTTPVVRDGGIERGVLNLPPKVTRGDDGQVAQAARQLGPGGALKLQWPGYFEPVLSDVNTAVGAAVNAKAAGLVDDEHATKFISDYFRVEDVPGMMKKAKAEASERQTDIAQQSLSGLSGGGNQSGGGRVSPFEKGMSDKGDGGGGGGDAY
jgi:hypothetical protein